MHNRKVMRDHFNDKINIAALRQGASVSVALGALVDVIARKNNIDLAPDVKQAFVPHVNIPDMPKSPSLLEYSDTEDEVEVVDSANDVEEVPCTSSGGATGGSGEDSDDVDDDADDNDDE